MKASPLRGQSGMSISPARREAFAILLEVERGHGHADDLLRAARVSALTAQDRNLCTTLVMGVLRWQIWLDAAIRSLLSRPNAGLDPEIEIALRMGGFQLLFLDRIPSHAAIGESVALAKAAGHRFASGMVNAVLRKAATLPRPTLGSLESAGVSKLAAETSAHPLWMAERWAKFYGLDGARAICMHGREQAQLSLRVAGDTVERELEDRGIRLEPGAVLTAARRVIGGDVTATAAFREGRVRVQEEGSQLIAELAGHGARILDCCAAPGGKTLVLAECNPLAEITACEVSPARAETLRRRIAESAWGVRIQVIEADAAELPAESGYDLVLADVPCSGTGTLGRNPEIRHRLRVEDLARHHERQCAILRGALRAGRGRVLYSTCSMEPEENQDVLAEVLAGSPGWRRVSLDGRIRELAAEGRVAHSAVDALLRCVNARGELSLLPGAFGAAAATDGFFAAMLGRAG